MSEPKRAGWFHIETDHVINQLWIHRLLVSPLILHVVAYGYISFIDGCACHCDQHPFRPHSGKNITVRAPSLKTPTFIITNSRHRETSNFFIHDPTELINNKEVPKWYIKSNMAPCNTCEGKGKKGGFDCTDCDGDGIQKS